MENGADGNFVVSCWNQPATGVCAPIDANHDGYVNIIDVQTFAGYCPHIFGGPTPTPTPTAAPPSLEVRTYHYDLTQRHAVSSVEGPSGTTSYNYDNNGNMSGGGGRTITWNVENRPTRVVSGSVTVDYVYDGDGRLVKKTVEGGSVTIYVGGLYEKNLSTGEETRYYFANGRRIAIRKSAQLSYLLADHLGSTSRTLDANSSLVSNTTYYPFGASRSSTGASPTDRLFTGQQLLDSTGLYNYGARFYDPYLNRFISPDPVVPDVNNPQALNRYSYTYNNPLKYVDSDGHIPLLIPVAVWALANAPTILATATAMGSAGLVVYTSRAADTAESSNATLRSPSADTAAKIGAGIAIGTLVTDFGGGGTLKRLVTSVPIGRGLGQWVRNRPNMPEAARAYQQYVTGAEEGFEFLRNDVHFDGLRLSEAGEGVLLDAKFAGSGPESIYSKAGELSFAGKRFLHDARGQLEAAKGLKIEWHVSDRTAWQSLTKLFQEERIGIDVIYTPWTP